MDGLLINSYRFVVPGPAYNPITAIPWVDAYWCEGPNFQALGLADGATLTTWPSEITGGTAMGVPAGAPAYRAAASNLNNQPAVDTNASSIVGVDGATSIPQPWTCVAVAYSASGSSGVYVGAQSNAASAAGIGKGAASFGTSNFITYTALNGSMLLTGFGNGATSSVTRDGVSLGSGSGGTNAMARRQVMGRSLSTATSPVAGLVAFAGFIGRALTAPEAAALLAWSQSHYGTP